MSTEREAFEAYWNSLVTPPGASEELLHSCEFAAWHAWQAALAQPAVQGELMTAEQAHAYIDAVVTAAQEKP